MTAVSTDRQYFEKLYESAADPFRNWSNEYEDAKRQKALGLLERPHYESIFEPGCGNGALSLDLAGRCDRLIAADWSADALKAASLHCAGIPNIEFVELDFPVASPEGRFDLLMVSELLYYFSEVRLKKFFDSMPEILNPGAEIMLVHWRGRSDDYPSNGDAVHEAFHKLPTLSIAKTFEHPQYLISSGFLK